LIGRLTGRIVDETPEGDLVIDVGGVGYEVRVPLGTRGRLAAAGTDEATLHVHTHVREDALELFGFASSLERDTFRTLIAISNIGPKLGVAILGSMAVRDLALVVARGDVGKLTTIPGVGKKTAERLVLELKGKLPLDAPVEVAPAGSRAPVPTGAKAETLAATLVRMGFRPSEAERAVAALAQSKSLEEIPIGDLVRESLALLSR